MECGKPLRHSFSKRRDASSRQVGSDKVGDLRSAVSAGSETRAKPSRSRLPDGTCGGRPASRRFQVPLGKRDLPRSASGTYRAFGKRDLPALRRDRRQRHTMEAITTIIRAEEEKLVRRFPVVRQAQTRRLAFPVDNRPAIADHGDTSLPHRANQRRRAVLLQQSPLDGRGVSLDVQAVEFSKALAGADRDAGNSPGPETVARRPAGPRSVRSARPTVRRSPSAHTRPAARTGFRSWLRTACSIPAAFVEASTPRSLDHGAVRISGRVRPLPTSAARGPGQRAKQFDPDWATPAGISHLEVTPQFDILSVLQRRRDAIAHGRGRSKRPRLTGPARARAEGRQDVPRTEEFRLDLHGSLPQSRTGRPGEGQVTASPGRGTRGSGIAVKAENKLLARVSGFSAGGCQPKRRLLAFHRPNSGSARACTGPGS